MESKEPQSPAQENVIEGPLRFALAKTFAEYLQAKFQPIAGHDFAAWFRNLAKSLPLEVPLLSKYTIGSSVGYADHWAFIPWITIRRIDIAPSNQVGLYVAYLFSSDMQHVYLSLNQGVSEVGIANSDKRNRLLQLARFLKDRIPVPERLQLPAIDLGAGSALAKNYTAAHVWGISYSANQLPSEDTLQTDLEELLRIYAAIPADLLPGLQSARAAQSEPSDDVDPIVPIAESSPDYSIQELVDDTLWPQADLEDILKVLIPLNDTDPPRQVILAGPPGSGKTWLATHLIKFATGNTKSRAQLIQFHPSYGYEQFVEGLQPVARGGSISFEVVPGIVRRMAALCENDDQRHYLIIDEINRANLSRVFGELMYLLEYRNEKITLPYSGEFQLPINFALIGTMNTADRSIRSIDVALRRRFVIFECPASSAILSNFYRKDSGRICDVPDLISGFLSLNEALVEELDSHHMIGHTFFMASRFTAHSLSDVWTRQIFPTISEYFFDDPTTLSGFTLQRFWKSAVL